MNYADIRTNDIANGPGIRTSLFVSGCRLHCRECFNPETWDHSYGNEFDQAAENRIIESLRPDWVDGLTLLGGDPMEPENQPAVADLLTRARTEIDAMNATRHDGTPEKTIWLYTGSTYEGLTTGNDPRRGPRTDEILTAIDVLVDGPFKIALKDPSLRFRGSSNQRIIDMRATRKTGKPTPWEDEPIFATHAVPARGWH